MSDKKQHDFDIKAWSPVLATAYGEGANQDYDGKREILSTILNRAESGKKEFGADTGRITDVLRKGYYAYSQQSPKYQEALDQKFPDKMSEDSYKEYVAILSGMLKGNVKRTESQFFLTPKEVNKVKKSGAIDMSLLEETSKNKTWTFYKYKTQSATGQKSKKSATVRKTAGVIK